MWSVGQVGQKFYLPETQRPPMPFTQIQTQIAQRHLFSGIYEWIYWVSEKSNVDFFNIKIENQIESAKHFA